MEENPTKKLKGVYHFADLVGGGGGGGLFFFL